MTDLHIQKTFRLNNYLLPVLCFLFLVLTLVDSYRGWSILLIGFGGAFLLSYFWARGLSKGLSLSREMRFGWAQVGDHLEERFTLINSSKFPCVWVEVVDDTNMPDYATIQVRGVFGMAESRWVVRSICTQRGIFIFGPTTVKASDPFGLFSVTLYDSRSTTMMVVPPVVSLPHIQVAPGGRAGEGAPRINAPHRTVSSASVREYIAGDSLRWIHWKTSARRDDLFVRIFEGVPAGDWWIVMDLDERVQVGEGLDSTDEHAIILAASLANLGMQSGRSVGMIAYGQDLVWLPPQMSDEHNWTILRELASIQKGNRTLPDLLELARPSLSRDTSLILITPSVNDDWIEPLLAIRRQEVVPTILLFDPVTFGGDETTIDIKHTLVDQGITHNVIPRAMLDRKDIKPGREGNLRWQVTPLGKAIAIQEEQDADWRKLA
jgi:uncharacterized protein (DUF58 family)